MQIYLLKGLPWYQQDYKTDETSLQLIYKLKKDTPIEVITFFNIGTLQRST
jgi:hypothetical protein